MTEEEFSYTMGLWVFLDYVNRNGDNEIHTWLNSNSVPKEAKAKINARIATLRGFPIFPEMYFSAYKGWSGLYELKVVFCGVQYRPFGFYGPGRREFTLLVGGIEKGRVPRKILEVANERRAMVLAEPRRATRPHDFS